VTAAICKTGEAFFGGTTWRGKRCMRISVCNWQTNETDVERAITAVQQATAYDPAGTWQLAQPALGWLDGRQRRDDWAVVCAIAAEAAHAAGRPDVEASMTNNLGIAHALRRDDDAAIAAFERALAIHIEEGATLKIAQSLQNLGVIHSERGDDAAAMAALTRALSLSERMPEHARLQLVMLTNLGWAHRQAGRLAESADCYEQAIRGAEEIKDHQSLASSLADLGGVRRLQGRVAEALQHYKSALTVAREIDDALRTAWAEEGIGRSLADLGQSSEAYEYLYSAIARYTSFGDVTTAIALGSLVRELRADPEAILGADRE